MNPQKGKTYLSIVGLLPTVFFTYIYINTVYKLDIIIQKRQTCIYCISAHSIKI